VRQERSSISLNVIKQFHTEIKKAGLINKSFP
jgi:hypothetical protein